ncbi:hypothetical protein ACFW9O_05880 [Streptomyces sp. NPDC059499]|uniref:hypothetical protein n=1 Tax=Streptomyces sp. NPDC059499 TaxID=3346852 RepID=UPI003677CA1A
MPKPIASASGYDGHPVVIQTDRRLIAVGTIHRHGGRTTTVRATEAGVTGSIRPTGGAR